MDRIEERTYKLALRVVRMVKVLPKDLAGQTIGKQVLRSATGIGANVEEAIGNTTRREFTQKMAIALREARETHYWLKLLSDARMIEAKRIEALTQEALEVRKILARTVATSKKNSP